MSFFRAKVKVPDLTQFGEQLKKSLAQADFAATVNSKVVDGEIKPLISAGASPVRAFGRLERYKNPDKYPGDRKPKRPVNLYLTGALLKNYIAEVRKSSLWIGVSQKAPSEVKEYATHVNLGTENMAARRFVPINDETFAVSVIRTLRDLIGRRARALFERTKLKRR